MSLILTNHKARRDYEVLESVEAGIVLGGTEIKALRAGKGQISDAFARVENGEVWLYNAHIDEYSHGNIHNHLPNRKRKLLLHQSEIRHLESLAKIKGNALVPVDFHWKNRRVKVQLIAGKGKAEFDKREDLKRREARREMERASAQAFKRRR